MDGPQNVRPQLTKSQRKKLNRQKRAQNEENTKESDGGKTQIEQTRKEGDEAQVGNQKRAQQAGGKKRSKERGLKLVQVSTHVCRRTMAWRYLRDISSEISQVPFHTNLVCAQQCGLKWWAKGYLPKNKTKCPINFILFRHFNQSNKILIFQQYYWYYYST